MFRTVFPSIIRSSRLYIQRQVYVIYVSWLLASKHEMELFHLVPASKQSNLMLYIQSWTPDDGGKDRPKHVECYSINSKNCASSWFYYRKKHYCCVNAKTITYFECVFVALCIQHAVRIPHIVICGLPGSTGFFHMSHKRRDLKKSLLNITWCVLISSTTSGWNISHSTKKCAIYNEQCRLYRSSCKVPVILVRCEWNWIFSTDFRKNIQIQNFVKIRLVGAELLHVCGQTDMTKLIVALSNFAQAPRSALLYCYLE